MIKGDGVWRASTDKEVIHIYPLFGKKHVLTEDCWCHPTRDPEIEATSQTAIVLVHNEEN